MKKFQLMAVACLMSIALSGQVTHTLTFNKDFNVLSECLQDGNLYSKIEWDNMEEYSKEGYPVIPVKYIRLLIPYNAKVESVNIRKSQAETVNIKHPLPPGQKDIPFTTVIEEAGLVNGLESIYKSGRAYPEKTVEILEHDIFRGNKIVTLAVYPFQYIPAKAELLFYSTITIDLNLTESKAVSTQENLKKDKGYVKVLASMIDNKNDIEKYNTYKISEKTASQTTKAPGIVPDCDYVIITPSSLSSGFNEFMIWK